MDKKRYQALRQSNYMQLRKLCEAASEDPSEAIGGASGALASEDLLRLVSSILDLHNRGILDADKSLHAIRELVRE